MKQILPLFRILLIFPLFLLSWVLVHIVAFLGIFLAIAFPLGWIFAPKQTVCLLCRAGKEGSRCPFCRKIIIKNQGVYPKDLTSAALNSALIIIFTLISAGVVLGESRILRNLGFPPTPKTVSFVIPTKGQFRLGEVFPMKIEIVGIKTPINAVQADLSFSPSKLEVVSVSTDESFANIFVQKEINNAGGYVRLTGGLPNPGFFSDHGIFGTVFFRGKAPGVVQIEYLPTSMVLANDGRGTNVLRDLASVSYLILPERISQAEENMQKSIGQETSVLGESIDNTQMKFYDETKVLGASIGQQVQENKPFILINYVFEILEKIDRLILDEWIRVLRLR